MTWPRGTREVAAAFWSKAGGRKRFGSPPDLEAAIAYSLPAAIVSVPALDTDAVRKLLERIGGDLWRDGSPRALRGCLVADAGVGLIMVNADDDAEERRVTIAHEVAHFVLHYQRPREQAEATFGIQLRAVMDRLRAATAGEMMSAALRSVPIEPYRHAMERTAQVDPRVSIMEGEADDLAIEILAPRQEIKAMADRSPGAIRERFGVTAKAAANLAALVARSDTSVGVMGLFPRGKI